MALVVATVVNGATTVTPSDAEDTTVLLGWSMREIDTPSGVVVANFHNSTTAAGPRVGTIQMGTGGESQAWFWPGIRCDDGIHLNLVAGGLAGVIYWRGTEPE
jgi:hypothetical protein